MGRLNIEILSVLLFGDFEGVGDIWSVNRDPAAIERSRNKSLTVTTITIAITQSQ